MSRIECHGEIPIIPQSAMTVTRPIKQREHLEHSAVLVDVAVRGAVRQYSQCVPTTARQKTGQHMRESLKSLCSLLLPHLLLGTCMIALNFFDQRKILYVLHLVLYKSMTVLLNMVLYLSYTSCCWIDTLIINPSSGYTITTRIDLSYRQDIAGINSSPVTAMQPIVRLQHGCSHSIKIPGTQKVRFILT